MQAEQFLKILKTAALDAVADSKPTDVCMGVVVSESPLAVQLNQKLTLTEDFLLLSRAVTEYTVTMTVEHTTETALGGDDEHSHGYMGEKEFLVQNQLKEGEKVILIRLVGGQKYLILDRVG